MAKKAATVQKKRGRPSKNKIDLPITPPGQMEDRILKHKEQSKGESRFVCPHCDQSEIHLVQRPNLYRCMLCGRKFLV